MISCRRDEDVSTVRAAPELLLLPPSPLEWLPEDHLAYFIVDVVSQLDLRKIVEPYEREERGYPPHQAQSTRRFSTVDGPPRARGTT